jgi:hypothetical protein
MTITPHDDTEFETTGRRRKITKFALAGVAVLGVGAALTSAAWSDDVFFSGTTNAAEFELEGYDLATGTWLPGDSGAAITIPASELDNVSPNTGDTVTLYVRNAGSVDINLNAAPIQEGTGDLFAAPKPALITWGGSYSDPVLSPGEQASFTVTVTGGNWVDSEYLGLAGAVSVQVTGQS